MVIKLVINFALLRICLNFSATIGDRKITNEFGDVALFLPQFNNIFVFLREYVFLQVSLDNLFEYEMLDGIDFPDMQLKNKLWPF